MTDTTTEIQTSQTIFTFVESALDGQLKGPDVQHIRIVRHITGFINDAINKAIRSTRGSSETRIAELQDQVLALEGKVAKLKRKNRRLRRDADGDITPYIIGSLLDRLIPCAPATASESKPVGPPIVVSIPASRYGNDDWMDGYARGLADAGGDDPRGYLVVPDTHKS